MRLCGLYTSTDAPVPLEGVHVEAKIVDMVSTKTAFLFIFFYFFFFWSNSNMFT